MAIIVKDRVRETTNTTGTGTLTLIAPVTGFQSFSVIGDGNQTYYSIVDVATGAFEVGIGTYTASGTTLSRQTVLESSNANALVSFGSGTKDVFVTYPADRSVSQADIGTAPNEIPLNQYLGNLAYQDAENIAGDVGVGGTINDSIKIDTNGNVGIGTVVPSSLLELYSDNPRITLSDLGVAAQITNLSGNLYYETSSINRDHIFEGAGVEAARITGDGNVGIGTSSPAGKLHVVGQQELQGTLAFQNNTPNGTLQILPATDIGNPFANRIAAINTTAIAFETFSTERVRITSAGRVGIGTSSPAASAILDVQSTFRGVRMPNMTTTEKNAIASPAAGLMVFDITLSKLSVYSGVAWETITSV